MCAAAGVIVATIEKANLLLDRMLEERALGQLSCIVVDELHMVGEEERGYLLELMLNKIRYGSEGSSDNCIELCVVSYKKS